MESLCKTLSPVPTVFVPRGIEEGVWAESAGAQGPTHSSHSFCSSHPSAFTHWSQMSYFLDLQFKYLYFAENGQVLSCGSNSFGQLGIPHGPRRCVVPQAIEVRTAPNIELACVL